MSDDTLVAGSELVFFDAGIGTWSWNEGDGVFTLSPDALRLLQVHSDELPLRFDTILEAVDADDRAALSAAFGRMVEDLGTHSAVFRARLDSGESRWFRAVGRALRSESGAAVTAAGVLLDVTAEHRAETFRDTFFEQPNGLHLVAAVDGTIELVNSGWEVILGHRPDTLVGSSFLELVHPDDREATLAEMANLGMGLTTHYFENRYRAADGDYRLIAWSAAVPAGDSSIFAVGTDITEKDAARRRLQEATVVFRSSGEAIVITDADGVIKEVNDAFTKITGYEREEAVGQHTRLLRSGRHDKAFYEALWSALQGEGQWRGEIWNRRKNGEVYPELLTITRIDGDGSGYVAMFTDISNIKQTEQRLQRLAHYDPLTELPNRYLINERLEQSLRRAQRSDYRLAVLFLDVDGFKNVNDSLGHQAGDTLLTETAARLRGALRDMDNVGRIGGDEFLVVLEDIESADGATIVAEKILGALREPLRLNGRAVTITASIGISMYPEDGDTAEALMSNADAAMYNAKEQGRDTFRFYSERLTKVAFQHVLLDSALREAIPRGELLLAFQPQVDLADMHMIGLEVLLRWNHPQLGAVPPAQFIPHAERTGLIRAFGQWVLDAACRQGADWLDADLEFGVLAVNVSAPQFRDDDFVDRVRGSLLRSGLPPERLELEITESVLLRDAEELIARMHELTEMGVRFAIDDFGTGYSSLAYLKRMPIHRLKLDRSFVADIAHEGSNRIISEAVIALGRALDLRVIAEGVEHSDQERTLREMGCEEAQGYRFSMPLYAPRMEDILRRRRARHTTAWAIGAR
jgi:diguanylate cyclase (GGDEF)-like protein/PAS domain S-box-containing protein